MPDSFPASPAQRGVLALSDGEIDFLWWFIQGSVMDPNVRANLSAHWGMCSRHALGFFAIEAAFRPHLIHGSAIVFNELMRRATHLLDEQGLYSFAPAALVRHQLRVSGPCHMCRLGYGPTSAGHAPQERLAQGRDLTHARAFAAESRRGWTPHVCGRCAGTHSPARCRIHLLESLEQGSGETIHRHRATVDLIAGHLQRFEHAFRWDSRGTDDDEDRGALIAAIGWCSGWGEILSTFCGE